MAQKIETANPKSTIFLSAVLIVFFGLERPDSKHIKPACIKKTNKEQVIIQREFIFD